MHSLLRLYNRASGCADTEELCSNPSLSMLCRSWLPQKYGFDHVRATARSSARMMSRSNRNIFRVFVGASISSVSPGVHGCTGGNRRGETLVQSVGRVSTGITRLGITAQVNFGKISSVMHRGFATWHSRGTTDSSVQKPTGRDSLKAYTRLGFGKAGKIIDTNTAGRHDKAVLRPYPDTGNRISGRNLILFAP